MSNIQLVVFDIAGTTVKDNGNVAKAFIEAFAAHGIAVAKEDVQHVMGWRKIDAIRLLLEKQEIEGEPEGIHDSFIRNIINSYENDSTLQPMPFAEGVFAELQQKGIRVALNTGFTREVTNTILRRLHWNELDTINKVICSDEVPQGRPHPFMIEALMQQLQITDATTIAKVGDTTVDIQEGRAAGCGLVISVTTGANTREELELYKPDHIIDSLQELLAIV